jgi:hypothetical protein
VADVTADTLPVKDVVFAAHLIPHIKPEHFKTTVKKLTKLAKKAVVFVHATESGGGGYQFPVIPVDEWRLGTGWKSEVREMSDDGKTQMIIFRKGAPTLVGVE